ncbi:hypothetical protein [Reichenbachiella ulvae]|uniref:Uncharacterized protein n=1 Tax=Reichenbachiella ulvae TaxID=2980104 RepID=A0ABT3CTJ4_9BACT|nr:hypothetical protein [Reichenbachiella ulvae]MCV9386844.1 hypothetical protein [Reichenbachiella ulvae]
MDRLSQAEAWGKPDLQRNQNRQSNNNPSPQAEDIAIPASGFSQKQAK